MESNTLSARDRKSMGLDPAGVNHMPMRKSILEYIERNGRVRARDLAHLCDGRYTPAINWLQREGYAACDRSGTAGATWAITPLGRRWIAGPQGEPAPLRERAYGGCVTESKDRLWPDVRGGASRAFEIQSRGIAT